LLAGVDVRVADFESVTTGLGPRDFVYFDPPYVPVSKTSDFTAYSSDKFDAAEQRRLRDRMRELKKRGVPALLSNADTAETRELYREFFFEAVLMRRNINRDANKRGDISELLVTTVKAPARSSRRAAS
jgi:DNA adenine methylase